MKKLLFLLLACTFFVSACGSLRIGPKGEGEYVEAESLVPYNENNLRQMKKDGILAAQKSAVEKVAGVFISSATTVDQAQLVEDKIVSKTAGFIRRSHVTKSYRKGDEQAVYRALKNQPFALINGDNLSQNNIENPNSVIDKARTEGARFVIVADVETNPISALPGTASPFKSYRARAAIKTFATNNYAVVAEGADQLSGLDPLDDIAAQKSISAACEAAAKRLVEPINAAINSAKVFNLTVKDVGNIERLKQVQDILKDLREIEDYNLIRYANSAAQFEVSANIGTPEELTAKIIRKYNINFTVVTITPNAIVLSFN